jgi:hypothetical protein
MRWVSSGPGAGDLFSWCTMACMPASAAPSPPVALPAKPRAREGTRTEAPTLLLLLRQPCRPAEECLLALLTGPHSHAALQHLDSPSLSDPLLPLIPAALPAAEAGPASEVVLQACLGLGRPSPARARIMLVLVQRSEAARGRFARFLPSLLLPGAEGRGAGGGGPGSRAAQRREKKDRKESGGRQAAMPETKEEGSEGAGEVEQRALLACLLPAGQALLRLALEKAASPLAAALAATAAAAAAAAGNDAEEASGRDALLAQAASVAVCLRRPLLSFLAGGKGPPAAAATRAGLSASGSAEAALPGAAGAAGAAGASGTEGAAALLHTHALPCLRLCLHFQPLSREEREGLLPRLLPPKGLPLGAASLGAPAPAGLAATSAERAQAAALLLEAQQAQHGRAGQQRRATVLLQYLQTYAATLAGLFK